MARKTQPAHINYFFRGGYVELGKTIKNAFCRCGRSIRNAAESLGDAASDLSSLSAIWDGFLAVVSFGEGGYFDLGDIFGAFWSVIKFCYYFVNLFCVAIVTTAVIAFFSAAHIVLLFGFFLIAYLFFAIVKLADVLYCALKKISTSCPRCQHRYSLPTYVCQCGDKHSRLVPGRYGIFKRKCYCSRKLKTTFFNGRHKLPGKWICPDCGYELGGPLQVDIPIPVVGGPSSGKTCYISMAITEIEKMAAGHKLIFEYKENVNLGDDYQRNKATMDRGIVPSKTTDFRMRYYQFYLTPNKNRVRNLISLCDVAGETYEHNDEIGKQIGYKNARSFLLIIDPLSLQQFREGVSGEIELSQYRGSQRSMDEVLDVLIRTLENMHSASVSDKIKADVAIVFTKCDIPGIEDRIGTSAVKSYMASHEGVDEMQARNEICEAFMRENEEVNFLNMLKNKFGSYQFFTSSALGHVENGDHFEPVGVAEPVLWLIDKASASINLKALWGKHI